MTMKPPLIHQYKFHWRRTTSETAVTYGDDLTEPPMPVDWTVEYGQEIELVREEENTDE